MAKAQYQPRLKKLQEDLRRADRRVQVRQRDAGSSSREDRDQHGRRRSRLLISRSRRSRPRSGDDRRPKAVVTRPASRSPASSSARGCRSAPRSRCARTHVRVPGPSGHDRAAARERLPRLNPKSFDGRGNYAMGIKEHIVFPEINYDQVDQIWGMDIVVCTTAKTDDEARALLKAFNFPSGRNGSEQRNTVEMAKTSSVEKNNRRRRLADPLRRQAQGAENARDGPEDARSRSASVRSSSLRHCPAMGRRRASAIAARSPGDPGRTIEN